MSIYLIGTITQKFTLNKYYSFFATFITFLSISLFEVLKKYRFVPHCRGLGKVGSLKLENFE